MVTCTLLNRRVTTITLTKRWGEASTVGDTASMSITDPGPPRLDSATSVATGLPLFDLTHRAALIDVPAGTSLSLQERVTFTGTPYASALNCNGPVKTTTTPDGTTATLVAGTFTVPAVPSVTCIFDNSQQAVVQLVKEWAPGSTVDDLVRLTIAVPGIGSATGTSVAPGTLSAGPGIASPALLPVLPGQTVTLTEEFTRGSADSYARTLVCTGTGPFNYAPGALTGMRQITAADAGTVVTCTFTNNGNKAEVVVAKQLVPENDPAPFDLLINGEVVVEDAHHGKTSDPVTVTVGTEVNVTEEPGEGVDPAFFTSTVACDNDVVLDGTGTFTVPASAVGKRITCTFTNTHQPATIELTKRWLGPINPAEVVLVGSASGLGVDAIAAPNNGATPPVATIPVLVGQTVRLGERLPAALAPELDTTLDCGGTPVPLQAPVAAEADAPVTLLLRDAIPTPVDLLGNFEVPAAAANTTIRCTFTDARRSAPLTLQKAWVDGAVGDSATLTIDGTNDGSAAAVSPGGTGSQPSPQTVTVDVFGRETVNLAEAFGPTNAGSYTTNLACTDASGLTYTAGAAGGTYTMPVDPVAVTCTFTNTRLVPGSLTITKQVTSPPARNPDGTLTLAYDIVVANPGQLATGYQLTDTFAFAEGVVVVAATTVNVEPGNIATNPDFNGASQPAIASARLPGGASHRYRVTVVANVAGVDSVTELDCTLDPGEQGTGFLNRATVNPTAEACAPIPPQADLRVRKVVDQATVTIDEDTADRVRLSYTLEVTNGGPSPAVDAVLTDRLPPGSSFVSATPSVGTCTTSEQLVTCQLGTLAMGAAATISVVIDIPATQPEGSVVNVVGVSAATSDPILTNNVSAAITVVQREGSDLPVTGSQIAGVIGIGTLLVVSGVMLRALRRRRTPAA